jgi:hypothetical protein
MKNLLDTFNIVCKAANVKTLSEEGLIPETYYSSTLKLLNIQFKNNKAFGCNVKVMPLPSIKYSKGNASTLTDGIQGSADFKMQWLGWEGQDAEITIDLGKFISINNINISTLNHPNGWILFPQKIEAYTSENENNWEFAGFTEPTQSKEISVENFIITPSKETKTKFIKLKIIATKKLPEWHPSAGGASWFFLSEVIVN